MDNTISAAARAYAEALQRGRNAPVGGGEDDGVRLGNGGSAFADLVKAAVVEPIAAVREGERMSIAGAAGKADIAAVATAVTNAEMAVETVVAVRDRVVAAYQEILRMPI